MSQTITYIIYQMKSVEENRDRIFLSLDETENTIDLDYEGYEKIYQGYLEGDFKNNSAILESIFRKLNVNHPEDYTGHSLSVSDIVQLGDKYYHCQSMGWKEVKVADTQRLAKRSF
jgi:hypothetical protein